MSTEYATMKYITNNTRYRTDLESFGNGANFIHLTNYDLNKFNKDNFANLVSPEIQHDNMRW